MTAIATPSRPMTQWSRFEPDWIRRWLRVEGAAAFLAGPGAVWLARRTGGWPAIPFLACCLTLRPSATCAGRGWAPSPTTCSTTGRSASASASARPDRHHAAAIAGAVLVAHTGMDRAAGYGLKLSTSFQDTHLGRIGPRGREAGTAAAEPARQDGAGQGGAEHRSERTSERVSEKRRRQRRQCAVLAGRPSRRGVPGARSRQPGRGRRAPASGPRRP